VERGQATAGAGLNLAKAKEALTEAAAELYERWQQWCAAQGYRVQSVQHFGRDLSAAVPRIHRSSSAKANAGRAPTEACGCCPTARSECHPPMCRLHRPRIACLACPARAPTGVRHARHASACPDSTCCASGWTASR
jgi:hypothetical protein